MNLMHISQEIPKAGTLLFAHLRILIARILKFPMPTMAVLHGHAVAGGVFFALAFDKIIMTHDPKFRIHLNEIEIGIDFQYGIIKHVIGRTNNSAGSRLLCGHKFNPQDALADRIV